MASSYDSVLYPPAAYPQTHPDRLATVGTLLGMKPAPVERCRVLEIACWDGSNLIPMAVGLPGSQFVGVDLEAEPIGRGRALQDAIGLENLRLEAMDLLEFPEDMGEFDYIVAHGFYSWVPEVVREKVWDVLARHLSADGIAYVSYNCLPGGYLRKASRDMMRFHLACKETPDTEQAEAGRAFISALARHAKGKAVWKTVLENEAERLGKQPLAVLRHDELEDNCRAFSLSDVVASGEAAGLQYLGESSVRQVFQPVKESLDSALAEFGATEVVEREQYLDYLEFRGFRETLFCRREVVLDRDGAKRRMERLWMASAVVREGESFRDLRTKAAIATTDPELIRWLERLGSMWPSAERAPHSVEHLAPLVAAGLVELRTHPLVAELVEGRAPIASRLARLQLATGTRTTNYLNGTVEILGEEPRELLCQLDGSAVPEGRAEEIRKLYWLGLLQG